MLGQQSEGRLRLLAIRLTGGHVTSRDLFAYELKVSCLTRGHVTSRDLM